MVRKLFTIMAIVCMGSSFSGAQSVSIELIDTTTNQKTGEIGYRGTATDGHLFLGTPNAPDVKIKGGNVDVTGSISAGTYLKNGSEFDSVRAASVADVAKNIPDGVVTSKKIGLKAVTDDHIDSVSWDKIKGIPAGFADGVDNVGENGSSMDSVRAASIADSCRKCPAQAGLADGSVTSAKIAPGAVTSDKVTWPDGAEGLVWKMGTGGKPVWGTDLQGEEGATTISGITGLADSLANHRTLIGSKANTTDVYTAAQVDSKLSSKADAAALSAKANSSDVYTKTEVSSLVSNAGGASGVEYSSLSSTQSYVDLTSSNTSIVSITVSCPEDGYIVVTGTASVMYYNGASASLLSVQGKVTVDAANITGSASQVNLPSNSSEMVNLTFVGGYQVTAGNHTLRFVMTPSDGSFWVYTPSIICVFSSNKL